jgi:hypothetical protein
MHTYIQCAFNGVHSWEMAFEMPVMYLCMYLIMLLMLSNLKLCKSTAYVKLLQFFFVSPVALRHRNKDPAPFRHLVDVFFCLFVLLSGNILPDIVDSLEVHISTHQ